MVTGGWVCLRGFVAASGHNSCMGSHAHASELGRALAERRWSPEGRRRAAVGEILRHASELDPDERDALRVALDQETTDE